VTEQTSDTQFEDKVNEALDTIEQAVADIRSLVESGPIRGLADDVKTALDTFVSTVEDAVDKAREAIGGDETGSEAPPAPDNTLPGDLRKA